MAAEVGGRAPDFHLVPIGPVGGRHPGLTERVSHGQYIFVGAAPVVELVVDVAVRVTVAPPTGASDELITWRAREAQRDRG